MIDELFEILSKGILVLFIAVSVYLGVSFVVKLALKMLGAFA